MKKLLALLLAATMLLSLCACNSPAPAPMETESTLGEEVQADVSDLKDLFDDQQSAAPAGPGKLYNLGETFASDSGVLEVTIDSFGFSDMIHNEDLVPVTDSAAYAAENILQAEAGKTYFYYTGTAVLAENRTENGVFYSNFQLQQGANNLFVGGGNGMFANGVKTKEVASSAEGKTLELRGYMEVPEAVESATDSPLVMRFTFDETYGSSSSLRSEFTVRMG